MYRIGLDLDTRRRPSFFFLWPGLGLFLMKVSATACTIKSAIQFEMDDLETGNADIDAKVDEWMRWDRVSEV